MPLKKQQRLISNILFFLYLIFLTWIIIFKMDLNIFSFLSSPPSRSINLTPYAYMNELEVFLNILIFIPFGIYAKIVFENTGSFVIVLYAFFLSFLYEAVQYLLAVGYSDITDLIDNTLGALVGIIFFKILTATFGDYTQHIVNILSITIVFAFLYILYKYNLL